MSFYGDDHPGSNARLGNSRGTAARKLVSDQGCLWVQDAAVPRDLLFAERRLWSQGLDLIAGVDEVGRGCLAGPVVAAAVILSRESSVSGVRDSKTLSSSQREALDRRIRREAIAVAVAQVDQSEIDRINILQASLRAMSLAAEGLLPRPQVLLVDGNQSIPSPMPQIALIRGDARSASVAAASIVAKVYRDALMDDWHHLYPQYNLARNKGYGTAEHRRALRIHGCCPLHRRTFRGVREVEGR